MTVGLQLRALGLAGGDTVVVHASFRAIRPIPGGPTGLIDAVRDVLGPTGTLVMPAMTDGARPFDPATTPTLDMGIVAETFRQMPGVLRSTHPGASFAAVGPHAGAICAPQPLAPPHGPDSPVGRMHALDGKVLLLGVGHDANTTVHLAGALAPVPYAVTHPCVVVVDGLPTVRDIPETDHCCENFARLDAPLRAAARQRDARVGAGPARLARARDVVDAALALLARDPLAFLCPPDATCGECDRARASVPCP